MTRRPFPPSKKIQHVNGTVERRPSEQEMFERRSFVRQLHGLGMRSSEIADRATQPQTKPDGTIEPARFDCKPDAIARLISELRADLARELEAFQPTARAAGLERLYQHLLRANSELQTMRTPGVKKDYAAIRGHMQEIRHLENQIAKMEGTLEPIKVHHSGELNVNLQRALTTMTPEQVAQAVAEEEAHLLAQGSIITTAEDAQEIPSPTQARARRQAVPASRQPSVLDSEDQTAPGYHVHPGSPPVRTAQRERSSDIAARREVRSPLDADVETSPGPRGSGPRVVS